MTAARIANSLIFPAVREFCDADESEGGLSRPTQVIFRRPKDCGYYFRGSGGLMRWTVEFAILIGAAIIATSIMFVGRYDIATSRYVYNGASGGGREAAATSFIYRLDRWTGQIDFCAATGQREDGSLIMTCPVKGRGSPL